jgi:hypothetical protein
MKLSAHDYKRDRQMTPERQVLLTLSAARKILFEGNVNGAERDPGRICDKLTYLVENLLISQEMKDYQRKQGISLDGSDVAQLIEEAHQAADRAVSILPRK